MECFCGLGSSFCRRSRTRPRPSEEAVTLTRDFEPGSRTRRRLSAESSVSKKHWRPGLTSIYEEVVIIPQNDFRKADPASRKKPSSSGKKQPLGKSHSFSHPNEYNRSNTMSMVMPTFSPAPFMF